MEEALSGHCYYLIVQKYGGIKAFINWESHIIAAKYPAEATKHTKSLNSCWKDHENWRCLKEWQRSELVLNISKLLHPSPIIAPQLRVLLFCLKIIFLVFLLCFLFCFVGWLVFLALKWMLIFMYCLFLFNLTSSEFTSRGLPLKIPYIEGYLSKTEVTKKGVTSRGKFSACTSY